jgi:hypothetical protein
VPSEVAADFCMFDPPSLVKSMSSSHLELLYACGHPCIAFVEAWFSFLHFLFGSWAVLSYIRAEEFCTRCLGLKRVVHAPLFFPTPRFLTIQKLRSQFASIGVLSAAVGRFARHVNTRTLDFRLTVHFARYLPNRRRSLQPAFAFHHLMLQLPRVSVRTCPLHTPRSQRYL